MRCSPLQHYGQENLAKSSEQSKQGPIAVTTTIPLGIDIASRPHCYLNT